MHACSCFHSNFGLLVRVILIEVYHQHYHSLLRQPGPIATPRLPFAFCYFEPITTKSPEILRVGPPIQFNIVGITSRIPFKIHKTKKNKKQYRERSQCVRVCVCVCVCVLRAFCVCGHNPLNSLQ